MITSLGEYRYVGGDELAEIQINGGIMTNRVGADKKTLRGEDIAFLLEAGQERSYIGIGETEPIDSFDRRLSSAQFNVALARLKTAEHTAIDYTKLSTLECEFSAISGSTLKQIFSADLTGSYDYPGEVSRGDLARAAPIEQMLNSLSRTAWKELSESELSHSWVSPASQSVNVIGTYYDGQEVPTSADGMGFGFLSRELYEQNASKLVYDDDSFISSVEYSPAASFTMTPFTRGGISFVYHNRTPWSMAGNTYEAWALLRCHRTRQVTYPPAYSYDSTKPVFPAEIQSWDYAKICKVNSYRYDSYGYDLGTTVEHLTELCDSLKSIVGSPSRTTPGLAANVLDYRDCYVSRIFYLARCDRTTP